MRKNGTWGADVELIAVASLLQSDVFLYPGAGMTSGRSRWLRFSPRITDETAVANPSFSLFQNHASNNYFEPENDL